MWMWQVCRMVAGTIEVLESFEYGDKQKAIEAVAKYKRQKLVGTFTIQCDRRKVKHVC